MEGPRYCVEVTLSGHGLKNCHSFGQGKVACLSLSVVICCRFEMLPSLFAAVLGLAAAVAVAAAP